MMLGLVLEHCVPAGRALRIQMRGKSHRPTPRQQSGATIASVSAYGQTLVAKVFSDRLG
jgi:hypothetical protein